MGMEREENEGDVNPNLEVTIVGKNYNLGTR
jgi:hypothetical protein